MTKKVFKKINLTCVLQNPNPNFYGEVSSNDAGNGQPTVVSGILSPIDGGMLFQETLTRKRPIRNSRLYEGQHIALVRRKDGFYYPQWKRPDGKLAGMIWKLGADEKRDIAFTGGKPTFYDLYGLKLPARQVSQGVYRLTLGESPVYFVGGRIAGAESIRETTVK